MQRWSNGATLASSIANFKPKSTEMDCPFHTFCPLIQQLDQNDDSIVLDRKLKYLASDINEALEGDENILWWVAIVVEAWLRAISCNLMAVVVCFAGRRYNTLMSERLKMRTLPSTLHCYSLHATSTGCENIYSHRMVIAFSERIFWICCNRTTQVSRFDCNQTDLFRDRASTHMQAIFCHFLSYFGEKHICQEINHNCIFSDAEKLKLENTSHFYNSITLLGEFYNRLHQKAHPILIIGRSLFDLLAKELRSECAKCIDDPTHVFNVQFARLVLTQVSRITSYSNLTFTNRLFAIP